LVFDPFDLTRIEVRHAGRPAGLAVPHVITRHSHPKARPELPAEPPAATGIDYLRLVADAHHQQVAAAVNYAALASPVTSSDNDDPVDGPTPDPDQLDILDRLTEAHGVGDERQADGRAEERVEGRAGAL
jgi:hypothetical protein